MPLRRVPAPPGRTSGGMTGRSPRERATGRLRYTRSARGAWCVREVRGVTPESGPACVLDAEYKFMCYAQRLYFRSISGMPCACLFGKVVHTDTSHRTLNNAARLKHAARNGGECLGQARQEPGARAALAPEAASVRTKRT